MAKRTRGYSYSESSHLLAPFGVVDGTSVKDAAKQARAIVGAKVLYLECLCDGSRYRVHPTGSYEVLFGGH